MKPLQRRVLSPEKAVPPRSLSDKVLVVDDDPAFHKLVESVHKFVAVDVD